MRLRRLLSTTGPRTLGRPGRMALSLILTLALTAAVGGSALTARAGDPTVEPPSSPVLHLVGGGYVSGRFVDSDKAGRLRWQGHSFTQPFDFDLKAIDSVQVPAPGQTPPRPDGDFRFELTGGDVVYGSLAKLDAEAAALELPRIGLLRVQRSHLLRIERWRNRPELVYLGPGRLADWTSLPADKPAAWREESGQLLTDQEGVALFKDVALPARAAFDLEISWKAGKPDFSLALGVSEDLKTVASAFRFEVWGDDLVVQRETEEADVASVAKVSDGPGRLHVKVYLDQERGRLLVDSTEGKPLADLTVVDAGATPRVLTGIRLENKKGDVRLERLEIAQWSGELLREARTDSPTLHRVNGSSVSAKGIRYDADAQSFVVSEGDKELTIPRDEVDRVTLASLADAPSRPANLLLQDGARLSGELLRVENQAMVLAIPGAEEPLRVPLDRLRSLVVAHGTATAAESPVTIPRLELEGVRLTGRLGDGPTEGVGASSLKWQPAGSETASPLAAEAWGRIIYKEPPLKSTRGLNPRSGGVQVFNANQRIVAGRPAAPAPAAPAPVGGLQGFLRAFAGGATQRPSVGESSEKVAPTGRGALYLRTGDVIPMEVTKLDEQGVTIQSGTGKSMLVSHDLIKAVELSQDPIVPIRINKAKRDRLLTLPRMQKGSPPTHLIRSKDGDYLRGRVVAMDETTLKVEVRLEVKSLPRARVARLIWLHAEDGQGKKDPQDPPPRAEFQLQAMRRDGTRLTFVPERVADGTISGKSGVLGECLVRVDEVDELLIGKAIEEAASTLAFQNWLLSDAPEPKVTEDDGEGGGGGAGSGLSSPLVGKPAPDFSLEQLGGDGKTFRLADAKGKVVVLDFWATWCGPCLQAMPQVEKVAGEFRDRGVQLVAVNLQESPTEITAMLERHKLNLTVALDKNGAVAEKYKANAIPQTVVIDREGKVARLFVGGGPHLGDQLREAIKTTLDGPEADTTPKAKAVDEPGADSTRTPAK